MHSGYEEKTIEDALRENARDLEIEIIKIQKKNDELREENERLTKRVKLLEELKCNTDRIIALQKVLLGDEDAEDIPTLDKFVSRQGRIFQNKVNHGFNTTNIYQEARYILEETAELMRAIEKNDRENMLEELADIVIFSYGCAEVARLGDLDTKIFEKMKINEKRVYKKNGDGDFVKTAISHV